MSKGLHDFASLTSINWNLPHCNDRELAKELSWEKETQENDIDNGLIPDVTIAELSKIKDASDTSAKHLQAANDKIRSLEAENAKLRARLLNQCQCNSLSCDNLPMASEDGSFYIRHFQLIMVIIYLFSIYEQVTNVDSDTLNETVDVHGEADQPQRESAGPCDIGNLALHQLFELIQIARQSEKFHLVPSSAILVTIPIKKNLILAQHRSAHRLPQVFFWRVPPGYRRQNLQSTLSRLRIRPIKRPVISSKSKLTHYHQVRLYFKAVCLL